ncbi:MAG: VWA domain-containing protein [Chloroflexi bacterium]|nr:VWA domain-containing protein [Chloroflexota bacterium]
MGFLAPTVFALGAALLAALLASYLLRPRRPVRRISSTFLWVAALHELEAQRPWRRVPPSLLLLLQIGALAAMIGAFARPFTLSTQSTGAFTILLLDGSASMQATDVKPTRFEAARMRATQLIDALEPAQQLALISLDAQPRVLVQPTSDHAQLRSALGGAQPTAQPANLPAALSLAGSLAEGHDDAQVVIVGDGSIDRSQVPADFAVPVRYLGVGTANPANLTVAGLTTRVNDGRLSALARVVNNGQQPATRTLTLKVDGSRFDARTVQVDPNSTATQEWDDLPPAAHTLEASLDGQDDLALDDAAWAVLAGDRPTRVLLVSDGNVFIEHALGLRSGTQVTRVSPGDYVPQNQAYDLIVLDGFVPPVLPSGASVLMLHPPLDNGVVQVGPDINVSAVQAAKQGDPLLTDVPLDGVHVSLARRLTPPTWADTVLASPETPLVLVGEQGGRRVGVFGFDVHQSDLPLQPGFPVLMQHLLDWLVPRASTATPVVQVGDSVTLAPLPETTTLAVTPPDGQSVQVAPPFPPPAFTGTAEPGLYQVVQQDAAGRETSSSFAVNFVNGTESRLAAGSDSGAAAVGPRGQPVRAPHEFWEALVVVGLILLGIELALAFWQFTAPSLRARIALGLRLLAAACLLLALLGVGVPQVVDRQATVFVADMSASTQQAQPGMAQFIQQATAAKRPDDAYAIVTTATSAALDHGLSTVTPDSLRLSVPQATDGTDLAAGLRLGADLLPAGYRSRLVLLSDGQETTGDALAQARALHARGVQVDAVPLVPISSPEVLIDTVSTPSSVSEGERFSIGVRLDSNVATDATVHVFVNDQPLADQSVSLTPGTTDLAFSAQAPQSGLVSVRASVDANQDTLAQNNTAYAVVEVQGPPRVLIAEQRPGEGDAIASALTSSGMRLDRIAASDLPEQTDALGSYAAVVLADVSATGLSDAQQTALRDYVRDLGRGLLATGGDTSFGQGDYIGTPLDDLLPVRSSVRSHRDQGRVALLLVMDTSGSMSDDIYHEGTTKLDMAKQAAILSAQQLSPRDQVGIMNFDSNQHWLLPLSPVLGMAPTAIQDRLAPLVADGGTDIFPALSKAFDAIKDSDARYKHIILMTDGMSCCGGDYASLQDRMRAADVTLSTIAIGGDADTNLLSQLAKQGDGRYYFAEHARDIPRLMTRETDLATRGPLVEGTITPRQVSPDSVLASLSAGGLPALGGYLVTSPKDLAEVLLVSDAADPILARWQYGLGRAVAWTSDLRGRWSQDWLQWSGTPQLFTSLVNWTIAPAGGPLRLTLRADAAEGHIAVSETSPGSAPGAVTAHVVAPDGSAAEVPLAPTAPGEYAATFPLNGPGTYLVRAAEDGVGSAEAGMPVSYPAEFRQVTADTRRMQQIAAAGGGHVLTAPAEAFADDLPPLTTPIPLQRVFVLIAAILLPLEVAIRRLRLSPTDLIDWLRHPHRVAFSLEALRPSVPAQSPSWLPGMMRIKSPPPPRTWPPHPAEVALRGHATPGLARETAEPKTDEDDALAAATAWLRSRRTTTGDKG